MNKAAKYLPSEVNVIVRLCGVSRIIPNTASFKKGLHNTDVQGVSLINNKNIKMLGQAFTLRYIPAHEGIDSTGVFNEIKHPKSIAIKTAPEGMIMDPDWHQAAPAASIGSRLLMRQQESTVVLSLK